MFCVPVLETQMEVVFGNFLNPAKGVTTYEYKHNFLVSQAKEELLCFAFKKKGLYGKKPKKLCS